MNLQDDHVYRFLNACEKAGIKNPSAFLKSKRHVVYDWLKGVFPFKILPTDIDGLVHLNKHFLLLEFKDESVVRNGAIPKGQLMCLTTLARIACFTVFIVGMDENDEPTCLLELHPSNKQKFSEANRSMIAARCKQWADHSLTT